MVIVITGASRGIGFEVAKYFARKKDAEIFAFSRNKNGLGQLASECAGLNKTSVLHPHVFDLDEFLENPGSLLKRIPSNIQHIDILINNAGILINKPFQQMSLEEIERIFRVNIFAPSLLIRELMPYMGRNGMTHVVNISSMGGFQGSVKFNGLSLYSASKGAVAILTECLAEELRERQVKVNCLALGSAQTEMLDAAFPGYRAPLSAEEMASFITDFSLNGHKWFNGKVLPVAVTTP